MRVRTKNLSNSRSRRLELCLHLHLLSMAGMERIRQELMSCFMNHRLVIYLALVQCTSYGHSLGANGQIVDVHNYSYISNCNFVPACA